MTRIFALLIFATACVSCGRINQKTKETINEGGEAVGKTATEFFEGVSEGVDKTLQCKIVLSQDLRDKGLQTGKFSIAADTSGGQNNVLVLYVIFDQDFSGSVSAKSFDKTGLETGRTKLVIEGKAGEAKYYDFVFDKRTYIEAKSRITIE
jgi:hypothetical protein